MSPKRGGAVFSTVALLCVVALGVVAVLAYLGNRPVATKYSALLSTTVGLYAGSDVRVLGVPVGKVDGVTPDGAQVRVTFHVDDDVKIPANALAAIISPTVVSDRYLQLAPPYTGGPTMPAGTEIPKSRTASPAEFDDLLASAQKLSTALGPQGVNDNGALSQALSTIAKNLNGNGGRLNTTLDNVSQAVTTLNGSRDNLAGTVDNLQKFTSNLKDNDSKVREFTQQFAQVSDYLVGERKDLGETLKDLSQVLGEVATFVRDNRKEIRVNVDRLGEVLATVNGERLSLEQGLDAAPLALDGLVNAYDAGVPSLDTRTNLLQVLVCTLVGIPVLGPILQTLLTPILGAPLFQGCANTPGIPLPTLPTLPTDALSQLHLPPGVLQGKLPTAAPAAGAAASRAPARSGSSDPDNGHSDSPARGLTDAPHKAPSLDGLFGGGR